MLQQAQILVPLFLHPLQSLLILFNPTLSIKICSSRTYTLQFIVCALKLCKTFTDESFFRIGTGISTGILKVPLCSSGAQVPTLWENYASISSFHSFYFLFLWALGEQTGCFQNFPFLPDTKVSITPTFESSWKVRPARRLLEGTVLERRTSSYCLLVLHFPVREGTKGKVDFFEKKICS